VRFLNTLVISNTSKDQGLSNYGYPKSILTDGQQFLFLVSISQGLNLIAFWAKD